MELPEAAGSRELEEETGITISKETLVALGEFPKRNHTLYLFGASVSEQDLYGLKDIGDEGEVVAIWTLEEIRKMHDFLTPHLKMLERHLEEVF